MIGQVLGNYRITGFLGQGGMGIVYEGEHALIHRKVAIKVILPERSQNAEIVQRFFNEARASTLIHHPGIVDIFDFGHDAGGSAYIVMEFLEGESLARHLGRIQQLSPALALPVLRQLASTLGAAHRKGIVHRDLKPDNLFLVPDPDVIGGVRVKVLDFGIAKLVDSDLHNSLRTQTGSVMGTPLYMSPEQCRGAGSVDHRSDIYSFGCIAYEMLSGRPPFSGEGVGDYIVAHMQIPPPSLRALTAAVPPSLDALVLRMLAKSPEARPQSMDEVVMAIDSLGIPAGRVSPPLGGPGAPASLPSTLGGSASQIVRMSRPGPRRRLGIGAIVVVLIGIGVGGFFAVGQRSGAVKDPVPESPSAAAQPIPEPAPAIVPDGRPEVVIPEKVETAAPPEDSKVPSVEPPSTKQPESEPAIKKKPKPRVKTRKPVGDEPVDPFGK